MKFGETLVQRSIPKWAHYNVDYDELKHVIKERTTNIQTSPVSIPGSGDDSAKWDQVDDELFIYLCDQHDRVNLFIKSKYGEIERRVDHLNRQLKQLQRPTGKTSQSRTPVQQSRRFQRLVEEADNISEDVQSLSRFASTQRIAFKKILKKYRKWTGSSRLSIRMNNEVFNKPTSLLQPEFTFLLGQLSDIQSILRHVSVNGIDKSVPIPDNKSSSPITDSHVSNISAGIINSAFKGGNPSSIDASLRTTPLGQNGGRAVYWVHPDNVDELRVLLLRHAKDKLANSSPTISRTTSVTSMGSRHNSISRVGSNAADSTTTILLDDLAAFVKEQNAATLSYIEETPGSCLSRVAMQICLNRQSKVATVLSTDALSSHRGLGPSSQSSHHYQTYRTRQKDLDKILGSSSSSESDDQSADLVAVQTWLSQHPEVKPLAQIGSIRSRFEGLDNTDSAGFWATLDEGITMSNVNDISVTEPDTSKQSSLDFPHVILTFRWEQGQIPDIVNSLNTSYLVERVRGFSLQMHAIYTICAPKNATKPVWMSLMNKDIRKVPPKQPKIRRTTEPNGNSSQETSVSAPSTGGPSGSGFSSNAVESSATSVNEAPISSTDFAPNSLQKKHLKPPQRSDNVRHPRPSVQRYWNEYDDPSDGEGDDVFTIYVDPNASYGLPGFATLSTAFASASDSAKASGRKLQQWLHFGKVREGETSPLLSQSSYDVEDSSDSEPSNMWAHYAARRSRPKTDKRIASGSSVLARRQKSREVGLLRTYIGCFTASYILLIMSSILQGTGKKKDKLEVDLGVVIGVVASLCFGIIGLSMMILRKERLSWSHRIAVLLAFAIVSVGSGILLAVMADAI